MDRRFQDLSSLIVPNGGHRPPLQQICETNPCARRARSKFRAPRLPRLRVKTKITKRSHFPLVGIVVQPEHGAIRPNPGKSDQKFFLKVKSKFSHGWNRDETRIKYETKPSP